MDGDGVAAAYVKAHDTPEFSGSFALPPEATNQCAESVEYHHFGRACVRYDDSAIREESGALHAVE